MVRAFVEEVRNEAMVSGEGYAAIVPIGMVEIRVAPSAVFHVHDRIPGRVRSARTRLIKSDRVGWHLIRIASSLTDRCRGCHHRNEEAYLETEIALY
jgi:hypothetical protein